ncbi:MAG: sulfur carrier protein ThiS [Planctomycetota bacterium]|nr:sulfur carrier protein ThiS [Planctomycetota bacterium]
MQVTINGKSEILKESCTVAEAVLRFRSVDVPCAVEVNERLVPHDKRESISLQSGDRIEIVTLVGGG